MCYINFGGIGFTLDDSGNIPLIDENRRSAFRLVDLPGKEYVSVPAPKTGWSQVLIVAKLFDCEAAIKEYSASDLFLGDVWIGSTEV